MDEKTRGLLIDKLNSKTVRDTTTDCWLWMGEVNSKGYGRFYFMYKKYTVAKVAAMIYLGMSYSDEQACHKPICPNKNCWNPDHLYVGDKWSNAQDRKDTGDYHGKSRRSEKG